MLIFEAAMQVKNFERKMLTISSDSSDYPAANFGIIIADAK